MDIVKPSDPMNSFLYYKINGTQGTLDALNPDPCIRGDLGSCGLQMPLPNGTSIPDTPAGLLPQSDRDLICNWIAQGARDN